MRCAVCGLRLRGVDHLGHWWVWVHDEGGPAIRDHWARPERGPK